MREAVHGSFILSGRRRTILRPGKRTSVTLFGFTYRSLSWNIRDSPVVTIMHGTQVISRFQAYPSETEYFFLPVFLTHNVSAWSKNGQVKLVPRISPLN